MSKRRRSRELALQGLYLHEVGEEPVEKVVLFDWVDDDQPLEVYLFAKLLIEGTLDRIDEIDNIIDDYILKKHRDRLSIVDKNLLRFSIFSILYQKDIHHVIIINEAVDLAKKYGETGSFKLINGALDNITKKFRKDVELNTG